MKIKKKTEGNEQHYRRTEASDTDSISSVTTVQDEG